MFLTIFPLAAVLCHQLSEAVPEQPLGVAATVPYEGSATAPAQPQGCWWEIACPTWKYRSTKAMDAKTWHFLQGQDISFRDKTCSIFCLGASAESSTMRGRSAQLAAPEAVGHTGQDSPVPSCWCPSRHLPSGDHVTFIDWAHSPLRCTCPFDFSIPIRVSLKQRSLLTAGTADATATTSWVYAIHLLC